MVDKNLELVEELTFADAHESYPDSELENIYDEFFVEDDFDEAICLYLPAERTNWRSLRELRA